MYVYPAFFPAHGMKEFREKLRGIAKHLVSSHVVAYLGELVEGQFLDKRDMQPGVRLADLTVQDVFVENIQIIPPASYAPQTQIAVFFPFHFQKCHVVINDPRVGKTFAQHVPPPSMLSKTSSKRFSQGVSEGQALKGPNELCPLSLDVCAPDRSDVSKF
jgi:hypothetical protein